MTTLRAFTWNDLSTYAELTAAPGVTPSSAAAEEYLRQPNLHPDRDCFLAERDGRVEGFVLAVPEPNIGRTILEGNVRGDARGQGIGLLLVERGVQHSRSLGIDVVHASALEDQTDVIRLLQSAGFHEAKRQWQMRLALSDLVTKETATAYEVRSLKKGEEALLADLQNGAFTGSWGFAPNVPEELAYRLSMSGNRFEDALVLSVQGKPLAYCWTKLLTQGGQQVGVIWMIGALPESRGLGLGRAMLLESVSFLRGQGAEAIELTVYADNDPAVGLYQATGFRKKHEILWFEKSP